MPIATATTWGAIFIARTGTAYAADAQTIEDTGFTILDAVPRAGETTVYAYGLEAAVMTWTNDFVTKFEIRGLFIRYPIGEEINTARLKIAWANARGQLAF